MLARNCTLKRTIIPPSPPPSYAQSNSSSMKAPVRSLRGGRESGGHILRACDGHSRRETSVQSSYPYQGRFLQHNISSNRLRILDDMRQQRLPMQLAPHHHPRRRRPTTYGKRRSRNRTPPHSYRSGQVSEFAGQIYDAVIQRVYIPATDNGHHFFLSFHLKGVCKGNCGSWHSNKALSQRNSGRLVRWCKHFCGEEAAPPVQEVDLGGRSQASTLSVRTSRPRGSQGVYITTVGGGAHSPPPPQDLKVVDT